MNCQNDIYFCNYNHPPLVDIFLFSVMHVIIARLQQKSNGLAIFS